MIMFKRLFQSSISITLQQSFTSLSSQRLFSTLLNNGKFLLSEDKNEGSGEVVQQQTPKLEKGQDRAANFYRKSIRQINVNDKGRGKFTEHNLLRLIKLTENAQAQPLLFEAYYNYLGHFTLISSTVVDKMIQKSMSFQKCSIQKILQIFKNHNYLAYFPHYDITKKLLLLTLNTESNLFKLLNIFHTNPLIKFNTQIVQILLDQLVNPNLAHNNYSILIKLLINRAHYKLFDGILTNRQLLGKIVSGFQLRLENQTFKPIIKNNIINLWCKDLIRNQPLQDRLHYEVAIVAVASKLQKTYADNLIMIKSQELVLKSFLYFQQTPESFRKKALLYFGKLDISQDLKARLSQFKPSQTQPTTVESQ